MIRYGWMATLLLMLAACGSSRKTHYERAIAHYDAGNFVAAVAGFQLAAKADEQPRDALFNAGLSLYKMARYQAAVETYALVINRYGEAADVHVNMGAALARLGQLAQARESYQQARTLEAHYAYPLLASVRFLLDYGDHKDLPQARAWAEQAIALEPHSSNAHYLLGLVLDQSQQAEVACEAFTQAARLDAENMDAVLARANCLLTEKRYDEALIHFMRAAIAMPENPTAFLGTARCFRERGDYVRALQAYHRAKDLGGDPKIVQAGIARTSVAMLQRQMKVMEKSAAADGDATAKAESLRRLRDLMDDWQRLLR